MKKLGISVALAVGLLGYVWMQSAYTNRFRLTIEIDTPDGIRFGSSVIETTYRESGNWGPVEARGVRSELKGRATFIDLGGGRNLIALLGFGPDGKDQTRVFGLTRAALADGRHVDWRDEQRLKGRGVLPADYIPTLITFTDLSDPRTATLVAPDDIGKTFGVGYSFRKAFLETTSEPVSHNIEKILSWWKSPGRPAEIAYRSWRKGSTAGASLAPEDLFQRE